MPTFRHRPANPFHETLHVLAHPRVDGMATQAGVGASKEVDSIPHLTTLGNATVAPSRTQFSLDRISSSFLRSSRRRRHSSLRSVGGIHSAPPHSTATVVIAVGCGPRPCAHLSLSCWCCCCCCTNTRSEVVVLLRPCWCCSWTCRDHIHLFERGRWCYCCRPPHHQ